MNAKQKKMLSALLLVGWLLCFTLDSYGQLDRPANLISFISAIIPLPVPLLFFTLIRGYFLARHELIQSWGQIFRYALIIGGLSYVIPILWSKFNYGDGRGSFELAAFSAVIMILSFVSAWLGRLQLHFSRKWIAVPSLTLLLLLGVFTSFTWQGGVIFLSGLDMAGGETWGNGAFIGNHPRMALIRASIAFHHPLTKEMVTRLLGEPRNIEGGLFREEWVYFASGYGPEAHIVFDPGGHVVDIKYGWC